MKTPLCQGWSPQHKHLKVHPAHKVVFYLWKISNVGAKIEHANRNAKLHQSDEVIKVEKFYRLAEIARILRVSLLTVKRWINEGKLKVFHPEGTRLYRVPESSLKEFVGAEWWEQEFASRAEEELQKRKTRRRSH
mgnify:CR=1 FL=1